MKYRINGSFSLVMQYIISLLTLDAIEVDALSSGLLSHIHWYGGSSHSHIGYLLPFCLSNSG